MKPQDNPFAKGVSINQDMLTDDFTIVPLKKVHEINPSNWEGVWHDESRELLALGREEE